MHLQRCLACKRCSASGLNCRYLNLYKLIEAYRTGYQIISKILKKKELSNFSWLVNASAWITFWMLHVKTNFVFHLFNVFLCFWGQSAKKVSAIFHIQFQWEVTEHFRNRIKKIWSVHTKIALIVKIFRKKIFADTFFCSCVNLPAVKIWRQSDNFPVSFSFLQCPLQVKNWFEKRALNVKQVILTSGQNLKPPFLYQYLMFLRIFFGWKFMLRPIH